MHLLQAAHTTLAEAEKLVYASISLHAEMTEGNGMQSVQGK